MRITRSIVVFAAIVAAALGTAGAAVAGPEPTNRGWSTPVGTADAVDQRSGD